MMYQDYQTISEDEVVIVARQLWGQAFPNEALSDLKKLMKKQYTSLGCVVLSCRMNDRKNAEMNAYQTQMLDNFFGDLESFMRKHELPSFGDKEIIKKPEGSVFYCENKKVRAPYICIYGLQSK